MRSLGSLALVLVLIVLGGRSAGATSPRRNNSNRLEVQELLPQADLIFRGTVRSIEYRMSEADEPNSGSVPHTFVTYDVEQVFKGATTTNQITLRFMGGPVDADRFVVTPEQPLFDVGDSDVLLVKDHLINDCPLVDCGQGRFRFIDGMVLNEEGQRIQVGPDGDLAIGPAMRLPEVNTTDISETIHLTRVEMDPDEGEPVEPAAPARLDPAVDFTPAEFVAFLTTAVLATHTPEALDDARRHPVRSADIRRPFRMRGPDFDPGVQDRKASSLRVASAAGDAPDAPLKAPESSARKAELDSTRVAPEDRRAESRPGSTAWILPLLGAALLVCIAAARRAVRGRR